VALELVTSRYPKNLGYFLSVFNDLRKELNIYMSWFKRIPHRYPPAPPASTPHRTSPATDRALEESKSLGPKTRKKTVKSPGKH
jgi:alkyl sulfatase BDS1-like metallo-beta-lactamase superfamily hydrolase